MVLCVFLGCIAINIFVNCWRVARGSGALIGCVCRRKRPDRLFGISCGVVEGAGGRVVPGRPKIVLFLLLVE